MTMFIMLSLQHRHFTRVHPIYLIILCQMDPEHYSWTATNFWTKPIGFNHRSAAL